MSTVAPVDIEILRGEIQKAYTGVAEQQEEEFIFPTGRSWAEDLGYPKSELARVPEASAESFAGVANPFSLGTIDEGETVLDLGCGAGTDLLIAAQMVGPGGRAVGIDLTPSMVKRARQSAAEMGLQNVEVHEGVIESIPLPDESVDVVISNGVIDLVPDKDAVFSEIKRVLRSGGRLQVADVVIHREVSEEAKRDIDLWTG
jgi:arsenite methyltransferase